MVIKSFTDKALLKTREDVLRLHLYFKFLQNNLKVSENDIDVIIELYLFGGYSNSDEQTKFIDICLKKKLKKTDQSIRNTFSKYVSLGIFNKPRNSVLSVNESYLPKISFDKLILQYTISHAE